MIKIDAASPQPKHDGKLVYVTGRLKTSAPIKDETFGLEVNAVRLERHVEMFQWREVEKRRDSLSSSDRSIGRRRKVYHYEKIWSDQRIDSSTFRHAGHDNPTTMPFPNHSVQADLVQLGGFRLSDSLIDQIPPSDPLTFRLADLSAEIARDAFIHHDAPNQSPRLYWSSRRGRAKRDAQIGDVRVYFTMRPRNTVSVLAIAVPIIPASVYGIHPRSVPLISDVSLSQAELRETQPEDRNRRKRKRRRRLAKRRG